VEVLCFISAEVRNSLKLQISAKQANCFISHSISFCTILSGDNYHGNSFCTAPFSFFFNIDMVLASGLESQNAGISTERGVTSPVRPLTTKNNTTRALKPS